MQPVALQNLTGKYINGEVVLTWKYPPQAPDTVFVFPVHGVGNARRVKDTEMREFPLCDVVSGTKFRHEFRSAYEVMRCEFLVFLGKNSDDLPDMERILDNPALTVTVNVGRATVFYEVKTTNVDADFVKHVITIKSENSMEQGILGYVFSSGGRRFSALFPGHIGRGKRKYPPFFTRKGADVFVEVVNGTTSDIQAIPRTFSFFS